MVVACTAMRFLSILANTISHINCIVKFWKVFIDFIHPFVPCSPRSFSEGSSSAQPVCATTKNWGLWLCKCRLTYNCFLQFTFHTMYVNIIDDSMVPIRQETWARRDRDFVMQKSLREYDPTTLKLKHDLIGLLFTDSLITTLWTPHQSVQYHSTTLWFHITLSVLMLCFHFFSFFSCFGKTTRYEVRHENSPHAGKMEKTPSASNFFIPNHVDFDFNRFTLILG